MKIKSPTLILDEQICRKNIERMAAKAKANECIFRPHFKSHQSIEVGRWFRDYDVSKITVSSVSMAAYFSSDGWKDITIAIPVNVSEIENINKLAKKIQLNLLVDSLEAVEFLNSHLESNVGVFIKVDTGYHRTGIISENYEQMDELVKFFSATKKIDFLGFLTHSGHTYEAKSVTEMRMIYEDAVLKLKLLRERYASQYKNLILSYGDTPSLSTMDEFLGLDEIRPGNFVFYDLMQKNLGVCEFDDIAMSIACPVISKSVERNECVIYGGAVHFSKESSINIFGQRSYGQIVQINDNIINSHEEIHLSTISQEHGIIKLSSAMLQSLKLGDIIYISPIHSCLSANLHKYYLKTTKQKILKYSQ